MSKKIEFRFKDKFEIMHFLDSARWTQNNAGGASFNRDVDLDDEQIILTHWLLYVTERQMSFEQIWEKGGIVFAEIVKAYNYGQCPSSLRIVPKETGDFRIQNYY